MPITPLAKGLKTKVLENSGNFLSNEHKNIYFLGKMAEKIKVKVAYPPSKKLHFLASHCRQFYLFLFSDFFKSVK